VNLNIEANKYHYFMQISPGKIVFKIPSQKGFNAFTKAVNFGMSQLRMQTQITVSKSPPPIKVSKKMTAKIRSKNNIFVQLEASYHIVTLLITVLGVYFGNHFPMKS